MVQLGWAMTNKRITDTKPTATSSCTEILNKLLQAGRYIGTGQLESAMMRQQNET